MRGAGLGVLVAVAVSGSAFAQTAVGTPTTDTQRLGMQLFNQSCQVCHTTVVLTGRLYGPALSRDSLGGDAAVMREVIANGTPRMPGFKHHFGATQIDAIVAYLKILPNPQTAAAAPASSEATKRDAD